MGLGKEFEVFFALAGKRWCILYILADDTHSTLRSYLLDRLLAGGLDDMLYIRFEYNNVL